MELYVTLMNGESHSLLVESHITVGDLKRLISDKFKVPLTSLKLSCENGQILNNDSDILSSRGLHSGSTISVILTPKPILIPEPILTPTPATLQVFLKNVKGQTSTYSITPGETVSQFKEKVYNKEGVPVNQQRLIHQGKQMDDGNTLQHYGVGRESTIHLTLRLKGG